MNKFWRFLCKIDYLTSIGFLLVLFIVLFTTKEQDSLVSICITGTFLYVIGGLWIRYDELDKHLFVLALLCAFISFINVNLSSIGDFNYYKKVIMFSTSILWIVYCSSIRLNKQTIFIIFFINILISFVYIISFKTGFNLYEGEILLTLNFPNPNQTGMFLLNSILYLSLLILSNKEIGYNIIIKGLSLIILTILLFLLYLTGCRSALGSFIVFLLLCTIDKMHYHFIHKKCSHVIWSVSPLIFVFIYLQYINNINWDLSLGLDNMGKSFSTRLGVWRDAVDMLKDNFLFGDYCNVKKIIKYSHAHNIHLDVWISYGLFPLLLFVVILYKSAWKINKISPSLFQRCSLYAFLTCFVNGFFEATLVSGSAGLFLLSFGYLLLSRYLQQNN